MKKKFVGGKLIAGDSTKLRAQNSKKNNYNPKKIERHIAYIDAKLNEYNEALQCADEKNAKRQLLKRSEYAPYMERNNTTLKLSRCYTKSDRQSLNILMV